MGHEMSDRLDLPLCAETTPSAAAPRRNRGHDHVFAASYSVDPATGCWIWHKVSTNGFGQMKGQPAHRVAYELFIGPAPKKPLCIAHLCRNTACVNPDHLEVTTYSANVKRAFGRSKRATHCKNGHAYTETDRTKNGGKYCRICRAEYNRAWGARNRPAKPRLDLCKRGHELRSVQSGKTKGKRYCRVCNNAKRKRYKDMSRTEHLHRDFGSRVRNCLRGLDGKRGRPWPKLLGYTLDDLIRHLERQFRRGMTWANYGAKWHIDHIVPMSAFAFTSAADPEFRACWSLGNLRPLGATENVRKGGRRLHLL